MKISNKLLRESQSDHETVSEQFLEELSVMELGGLQYLAGYVIKNLIAKAKKWTKKCEAAVAELLSVFLAESPRDDQILIAAKNRGGLSAVTENGEPLFIEMEKRFRAIIRSKKLSGLNINDEAEALTTDSVIVSYFTTSFTGQHSFNDNVKTQALRMIIELYFLIRINSITKDLKYKEKGLRKGLKNLSEDK